MYESNYAIDGVALDPTLLFGIFAAIMVFAAAAFFLYGLPAIITTWILFNKAGVGGWKSIIPVYNGYTACKVGKKSDVFTWSYIGVSLFSILVSSNTENEIVNTIVLAVSVVLLVMGIMIIMGMYKQYNAKPLFWWMYVLLPIVAVFMVKDIKYTAGKKMKIIAKKRK